MPQVKFILQCTVCGEHNYVTSKSRKQGQQTRLTLRKHCPRCNKHTEHRETRLRK
jgi:large subunit ribosomal protein L33